MAYSTIPHPDVGAEDAKRIRELTDAHSVMIARGAESNPSCFSLSPLDNLELTLCPAYLRVAKYLDTNWGLTRFCIRPYRHCTCLLCPDAQVAPFRERRRRTLIASHSTADANAAPMSPASGSGSERRRCHKLRFKLVQLFTDKHGHGQEAKARRRDSVSELRAEATPLSPAVSPGCRRANGLATVPSSAPSPAPSCTTPTCPSAPLTRARARALRRPVPPLPAIPARAGRR
ncbi:hypothetical protein C8R46DRAFT_1355627 [Mycena filopes]|nr:hypothetical protein C8R46DRAFT_1355627 [Mycena filopes]